MRRPSIEFGREKFEEEFENEKNEHALCSLGQVACLVPYNLPEFEMTPF